MSSEQSLVCKIHLLRSFFLDLSEILSCNYYVRLGFLSYKVFFLDSFRYIECVRKNYSSYNVLNISSKQLLAILIQHLYMKIELEETEERVVRLRKQKKIQCEKLICTIFRGIFNIKELEKTEIEKIVRTDVLRSEMPLIHLFSNVDELLAFIVDWSFIFSMLLFFPGLFADLGISDIVETPFNIRLGF